MKIQVNMPRNSLNIHQVHIADGFSNDCDELVHRCLQLQTLDYKAFCQIWKDLNCGMIYQGRNSGAEIAELSEEVIYIAKRYLVKDTCNFEESVAGLFLIYSLLKLQPFHDFASLRIVPDDVPYINRIEMVARRERRLDVLYILGEVLVKHTQYHAAERDHGMESAVRKYLEEYTSIDKLGVRPRGVFYRQNEELDIIRDLGSITRQYIRAKNSVVGQERCDKSLQYINGNLACDLNTSLRRIINGIIDNDDTGDDDDDKDDDDESNDDGGPPADHYDTVQAIKTKAMTNTVNPIKHLTRIEERKTTNTSPKKKSDLKIPTGKIRTGNHTKLVTTSPNKRKTKPKTRKKKEKETSKSKDPATVELNIEDFHKGCETTDNDELQITEQEIQIQIESIPDVTQADGGDLIEIEIIDNAENDETEVNSSGEQCLSDRSEVKDTKSIKTRNNRKRKATANGSNESEKKLTRQKNCKRTKLKSKFKKMGMLPVANFNEPK